MNWKMIDDSYQVVYKSLTKRLKRTRGFCKITVIYIRRADKIKCILMHINENNIDVVLLAPV